MMQIPHPKTEEWSGGTRRRRLRQIVEKLHKTIKKPKKKQKTRA